ncbi:MAG: hypothetical protein AAFP68_09140, partial [Pseudomonadota bacterium]
RLLLPALIPSWRFFPTVEASPRVQWTLTTCDEHPTDWQEFRPRRNRRSITDAITLLVWNPRWNETLFLVSCAERIEVTAEPHAIAEIERRVLADLLRSGSVTHGQVFQFRLVFVDWKDGARREQVTLLSEPHMVSAKVRS